MDDFSHIKYVKTNKGGTADLGLLNDFVGIVFDYGKDKNGEIVIHYPRTLGELPLPDEKENRKLLLNLVKSLKLLKGADNTNKYFDNKIEGINLDKFPLYSYLWIWDDFKSHGRLILSETTNSRRSSGRINWKKTFQGASFIFNDDVIYNDYVYKRRVDKEGLITEIYDYCVYKSLEMIFFLTNLSKNVVHPLYKDISTRKNVYINCLRTLIDSTFDDEKKMRYRHMLNVVKPSSFDSLIDKPLYDVEYRVYERMLSMQENRFDDMELDQITEADMVCKDCKFSTGCTGECAKYAVKPGTVMYGGECSLFEKA